MVKFSTLISLIGLVASALAADSEAWKTRSIYFVSLPQNVPPPDVISPTNAMVAEDQGYGQFKRFARTNGSTTACSNLGNYCGGTWKGMQNQLDYIQRLGFDAIWITPIVSNTPGGYHGYWAKDIYSVNTNYGSAADLKSLINAVHAKGMYIMVDVVVNHMGAGDISTFNPFNSSSHYHRRCRIDNFNDQSEVERCQIAGLPDLRTEDNTVRSLLYDWIRNLVSEYSIDGLRLDTVKHVEKDFWSGFTRSAGVYTIGEVFSGDPAYVGPYQNHMSALVNFPMYYSINDCYARKHGLWNLVGQHNRVNSAFSRPELLGTFLDNHDVQRFLSINNDWTLLKNALAYTMLARGIPILYGGTEQAYGGGNDPANREDLWRSKYNTSGDLYTFIQKLMGVKRVFGGLGRNDHVHIYITDNCYAFGRAGGRVVVVTTNGGSGTGGTYCFNPPRPEGTVYTSALGSASYTSGPGGRICVSISNGQPEVLLS
ncbi:glycoside hydrolase superfamily [Tuber brumale]|nr:glycoside hydrolase superfamily [Tuber brumale]